MKCAIQIVLHGRAPIRDKYQNLNYLRKLSLYIHCSMDQHILNLSIIDHFMDLV